jgi:hypothetical protein
MARHAWRAMHFAKTFLPAPASCAQAWPPAGSNKSAVTIIRSIRIKNRSPFRGFKMRPPRPVDHGDLLSWQGQAAL